MGPTPSRYKALIFDLGRVLVHFDFTAAYNSIAQLCPPPAPDIPMRFFGTDLLRRLETGRMSADEFHHAFCKLFGFQLDYQPFCDIWTSIFTGELMPESFLEGLAKRYRLVLLSNTNPIHFEMVRANYPHLRHFHDLVLSYEVGAMKPEAAIYEAAIQRAGCLPGECFYTDDIPEYVEGGKRAGLDAVQFESFEQIQREMRARGII
jgi:putative hydrolase of the HAD superfamily